MQEFIIGLSIALSIWACNSNSTENTHHKDSTLIQTAADSMSVHTQQPDILDAREHSIADKIALKNTFLMGKEISCRYLEIPSQLKEQILGIMRAISEKIAVITDGYHSVVSKARFYYHLL